MKRKITLFLLPFIFILLSIACFIQAGHANESGCIKCHTNELTLKTLHKSVKSNTAEEGEG